MSTILELPPRGKLTYYQLSAGIPLDSGQTLVTADACLP
jgi:hypothetical protein